MTDIHMIEDKRMRKNRDYVFLSGPVKYESDGGHSWRDEAYRYSKNCDWYLRVIDPTAYFSYDWKDEFQQTDRQIRDFYFQAIKISTVVLVNLSGTNSSIGTGMEVQYAVDHEIPVIGFGTEDVYPWIKDSCTVVFDDLETALGYITTYYDFDFGEEDL